MKLYLLPLYICTVILSAGEFEDAEKLFQQGNFQECDKIINKAFETKLSTQQKLKLQSMREYILGNNPDKIAENVKKAQEIATHRGWLTADLLNHSTLLIRRAENWKSRGIPEYQELSNAATKLLTQLKDGGNSEVAIKQVILQTKNFNLNGEYNEPIALINSVLQLYFPRKRHSRSEEKSSGEIELLVLLGEQYSGLAVSTRNEREKTNALSSAAKCYLQAIDHLPKKSVRYQDLSDRLCFCRETLRLLGYKLQLPTKIRLRKSIELTIFDEMLRTRRYHDVVIALESKSEPAMRLRYATALTAIAQSERAISVVKELKEITEPNLLLQMAQHSSNAGKKEDAAFFYQRFLALSPDSLDAFAACQRYTTLLIELKKYTDAAAAFLQQAELKSEQKQKEEAIFQAAQCYYQEENYLECIKLFPRIILTTERKLLLAQAYIRMENNSKALDILTKLLADIKLSQEMRLSAMKLAIFCSLKADSSITVRLLEQFLKDFPQDSETPEYTRHLLKLYIKNKSQSEKIIQLASDFLKNAPGHPDTVPFLLACSKYIPDTQAKEKLLRHLLIQKDFSVSELNALLKQLPTLSLKHDFLIRYKKPFANTPELCELYFQIAEIEFALKNYQEALACLEIILNQSEVFHYKECKKLQVQINMKLGNETEVRKFCQELLLTKLSINEKRSVVLNLAQSWERSGNFKKSIANAWTVIPLNGKSNNPQDRQIIRDLLTLIIRNAEKIGSTTDLQEAKDLLTLF